METNEEIYQKYMDLLKKKLVAEYDVLQLRASGNYEDQLQSEVDQYTAIMYGPNYAEQMENGRGPGYVSPKIIEKWIETKRDLPADMVENKKSASFAIAHNINKYGILVPNYYNRGKVISSVIDEFMSKDVPELLRELSDVYVGTLVSDVARLFNQVA